MRDAVLAVISFGLNSVFSLRLTLNVSNVQFSYPPLLTRLAQGNYTNADSACFFHNFAVPDILTFQYFRGVEEPLSRICQYDVSLAASQSLILNVFAATPSFLMQVCYFRFSSSTSDFFMSF